MSLPSDAGSFMVACVLPEACRPNEAIGKNLKDFRQQAEAAKLDAALAAKQKTLGYG